MLRHCVVLEYKLTILVSGNKYVDLVSDYLGARDKICKESSWLNSNLLLIITFLSTL